MVNNTDQYSRVKSNTVEYSTAQQIGQYRKAQYSRGQNGIIQSTSVGNTEKYCKQHRPVK